MVENFNLSWVRSKTEKKTLYIHKNFHRKTFHICIISYIHIYNLNDTVFVDKTSEKVLNLYYKNVL